MDEEIAGFQPDQDAGQPSGEDQRVKGEEAQEPKLATVDQLEQLKGDILKEMRRIQSLSDKAENRFSKQVEALQQAAERLSNLPASVPQSVKDKLYADALSSVEEAAPEKESEQILNPEVIMTNAAARLLDLQYGISFEEGDPELATLRHTSPNEYLASYKEGLENKKARIGAESETETIPGSPISRMPGVGQGTPSGGLAAMAKEFHQLIQNPRPTLDQKKRMKELEKQLKQHVPLR